MTRPATADNPDEAAQAIEDNTDEAVQAIQPSLDPDPATVESNLEDLCFSLQTSDALSNDIISCP